MVKSIHKQEWMSYCVRSPAVILVDDKIYIFGGIEIEGQKLRKWQYSNISWVAQSNDDLVENNWIWISISLSVGGIIILCCVMLLCWKSRRYRSREYFRRHASTISLMESVINK